ncbi:hypothetical protein [uncultured Paraglaciecola sp.]|uniref:hypothetical protein n=1 Tax=uncultured Paraglaciecola sp. TaxID=1765024 RepID=UPI002639E972|nr:hypothetical protein [uncultured Paraglaciecola sp.]
MADKEKLEWTNVNPASFKGELATGYAAMVEANKVAKAAREQFQAQAETGLRKAKLVSDDMDIKFSFRFGNIAFAEVDKVAKSAPKDAINL